MVTMRAFRLGSKVFGNIELSEQLANIAIDRANRFAPPGLLLFTAIEKLGVEVESSIDKYLRQIIGIAGEYIGAQIVLPGRSQRLEIGG